MPAAVWSGPVSVDTVLGLATTSGTIFVNRIAFEEQFLFRITLVPPDSMPPRQVNCVWHRHPHDVEDTLDLCTITTINSTSEIFVAHSWYSADPAAFSPAARNSILRYHFLREDIKLHFHQGLVEHLHAMAVGNTALQRMVQIFLTRAQQHQDAAPPPPRTRR